MLSRYVGMVSNEFLRGYLSAVYGRVQSFGVSDGANACLGIVW